MRRGVSAKRRLPAIHVLIARRIVLLVLLLAGMWGCSKAPRTLVVTVGGAGFSQMQDLREALRRQCPEAKVVSAGVWDAYKTDIREIVEAEPQDHVILIGHSFGCAAIDQAADKLREVDLAVFIDPAWDDFPLSKTIDKYLWFKRTFLGFEREAKIVGASEVKKIEGGHNDIPHSKELIAQVVAEVNRISRVPVVANGKNRPEGQGGTAVANADGARGGKAP